MQSAPLNRVPCQSNCVVAIYSELRISVNLIDKILVEAGSVEVGLGVWGVFMGVVMGVWV